MDKRFDYCPDVDGTWAVVDMTTGKPASIGGQPVLMIDLERAEAITTLLNRGRGGLIADDPPADGAEWATGW